MIRRTWWASQSPLLLPLWTESPSAAGAVRPLLPSSSPPSYSHVSSTSCCVLQTSVPDSVASLCLRFVSSRHLLLDRYSSVRAAVAFPHLCPCFCHCCGCGCGFCWVLCSAWRGVHLCEVEEEEEEDWVQAQVQAQVQARVRGSRIHPSGTPLSVEGCTARAEEVRVSSLCDSLSAPLPPPPLPCRRARPQGKALGFACGLRDLGLESDRVTAALLCGDCLQTEEPVSSIWLRGFSPPPLLLHVS